MAHNIGEHGLLSPAPSQLSVASATINDLPTPRAHPLPQGSSKQNALINYIDDRLLVVTRRYNKSFAADAEDRSKDSGYVSFNQVISDLDPILDIVWISATPSLQVQYLLVIAGHFRSFMRSFQFVTTSFDLARKLDAAFSSLLSNSVEEPNSNHISTTDKVRIRSLAEETRIEMINVASRSGLPMTANELSDSDEEDTDADEEMPDHDNETNQRSITLQLGKAYERTMEILGADLASLPSPEHAQKSKTPQIPEDVEILDL